MLAPINLPTCLLRQRYSHTNSASFPLPRWGCNNLCSGGNRQHSWSQLLTPGLSLQTAGTSHLEHPVVHPSSTAWSTLGAHCTAGSSLQARTGSAPLGRLPATCFPAGKQLSPLDNTPRHRPAPRERSLRHHPHRAASPEGTPPQQSQLPAGMAWPSCRTLHLALWNLMRFSWAHFPSLSRSLWIIQF